MSIANSPLAPGDAEVPYTATLSATGGIAPYRWSLAAGTLPSGIRLQAATGVIAGMTALAGSYTFTAKVTDSSGQSAANAFTLTVSSKLAIMASALEEADAGTPYTATLSATGGIAPYQWSLAAGTLPSGIQLQAATGVVTGMAALAGSYPFAAKVTDSSGHDATLGLTLVVISSQVIALPEIWVNNHEGDTLFSFELSLPGTWVTGPAPTCTFHTPYWTGSPTSSGLQSAIYDIEACRATAGVGIALDIPPALYTSAHGITIPQSSDTPATNFLVLRSTMDSSLPDGVIVCAKGPQDNLPTSKDIGIDNPACNGVGMSFQLGNTITNIPAGPITLANGIATNTSAYDDVQYMWTGECSGVNCIALQTCSPLGTSSSSQPPKCSSSTLAPDHWLIEDMEARMNAGNRGDNDIVAIHSAGTETSTTQLATHIHFRKDWFHGDWTSLATGANAISTAFELGCIYCSVVDSQVSQALRPGAEGHAGGANWGSQFKIDHNWLEGQSSGFFCGGFTTPPSISGLVPCRDVEMRRNRFTFPYSWLGVVNSLCGSHGTYTIPPTNPNWGCTTTSGYYIVRKNAEEMKEAQRVLMWGNIFENVDGSGGQAGVLGDLTVRNTAGSHADATNYQSVISDVTEGNNIRRNGCEGFELDSSSSTVGDGGGVSFLLARASMTNDLFYNITNTNPGCAGVNSTGIQLSSGIQQWKGTVTENSAGTAATFTATCSIDGGDCPSGPPGPGFQVFDINPGDPISVTGCTGIAAFNVPVHAVAGYSVPTGVGPLAAAGTIPASLTVTYPWTATANASDSTESCILTKGEGGPLNFTLSHVTFITDASHVITSSNAPHNWPNFQVNALLENSIFTGGGWFNNTVGEGTGTETFNYDYTSLTANDLVWPTRTSSKYTALGNNPFCPAAAPTMYFPITSYCADSTPTSSCIGFQGAMSVSSMPLTMNDYHDFALSSDSLFYAGNSQEASDGTSMGADITAIDSAQTQNTYVCQTPCGTGGPWPD
ncbi:MAG: Ig domain-containing protein [Candidatus Sulfotelmatobacter sp.]